MSRLSGAGMAKFILSTKASFGGKESALYLVTVAARNTLDIRIAHDVKYAVLFQIIDVIEFLPLISDKILGLLELPFESNLVTVFEILAEAGR